MPNKPMLSVAENKVSNKQKFPYLFYLFPYLLLYVLLSLIELLLFAVIAIFFPSSSLVVLPPLWLVNWTLICWTADMAKTSCEHVHCSLEEERLSLSLSLSPDFFTLGLDWRLLWHFVWIGNLWRSWEEMLLAYVGDNWLLQVKDKGFNIHFGISCPLRMKRWVTYTVVIPYKNVMHLKI